VLYHLLEIKRRFQEELILKVNEQNTETKKH
jgi:hypothetical protein